MQVVSSNLLFATKVPLRFRSCSQCPLNTLVPGLESQRVSLSNCNCEPNFYAVTNPSDMFFNITQSPNSSVLAVHLMTRVTGEACQECPRFSHCPGGQSLPVVEPGFWVDQSKTFDGNALYPCSQRDACTGVWRKCTDSDLGCDNFTLCAQVSLTV